jgi:hypothetical protein
MYPILQTQLTVGFAFESLNELGIFCHQESRIQNIKSKFNDQLNGNAHIIICIPLFWQVLQNDLMADFLSAVTHHAALLLLTALPFFINTGGHNQ